MDIRDLKISGSPCEVKRLNSVSRQDRPRLERKGSSSKSRMATLALVGAGLRSVSASPIGRTDDVTFASGNARLPWTPEDAFSVPTHLYGRRDGADSVDWSNPALYAGIDWNDAKNYAGVNFNDPTLYLPAGASPAPSPIVPIAPTPVPAALETFALPDQNPCPSDAPSTETISPSHAQSSQPDAQSQAPVATPGPGASLEKANVGEDTVVVDLSSTTMAASLSENNEAVAATTLLTTTRPAVSLTAATVSASTVNRAQATPTATSIAAASYEEFTNIAATQNAILIINSGPTTATFSFWENYAPFQPNFDSAFASVELAASARQVISLPASWSGRVQKMTGRSSDPATWGEVTFDGGYGNTYADVSYIRGYNAPLAITDEANDLNEGSLTDLRLDAPVSDETIDSGGTTDLDATEGFDSSTNESVVDYERASNVGTSAYVINSDNAATRGVKSKHLIFTFG